MNVGIAQLLVEKGSELQEMPFVHSASTVPSAPLPEGTCAGRVGPSRIEGRNADDVLFFCSWVSWHCCGEEHHH